MCGVQGNDTCRFVNVPVVYYNDLLCGVSLLLSMIACNSIRLQELVEKCFLFPDSTDEFYFSIRTENSHRIRIEN